MCYNDGCHFIKKMASCRLRNDAIINCGCMDDTFLHNVIMLIDLIPKKNRNKQSETSLHKKISKKKSS